MTTLRAFAQHPFVPPGGFCDFDVFAGGLWSQRVKQYLLNNGIAVMEANNCKPPHPPHCHQLHSLG